MPIIWLLLAGGGAYLAYEKWIKTPVTLAPAPVPAPLVVTTAPTTPTWLPPIPPLTKQYADYKTIVPTPADLAALDAQGGITAWDLTANQPIVLNSSNFLSVTGSEQENMDVMTAIASSAWGKSLPVGSNVTGTIFYMNVNGVSHRIYSMLAL